MHSRSVIIAVVLALSIMHNGATSHPDGLDQYQITFEQIPSPNFGKTLTILRDDRGFLWLGTSKRLCKYDGYLIRVFSIGDPLDVEQQVVTSMVQMDSVSLLLATGKGLWTFNLRTEQSFPFLPAREIADSRINVVVEDSGGTIWMGTNSHGLLSYKRTTGVIRRYTRSDGLSSNGIRCLLYDHPGKLWIGTIDGGLNSLEGTISHIEHYRSKANDPGTLLSDNITSLCKNGGKELWIGTAEGLNILNLETQRMARMDLRSYNKHSIMSIAHDPFGRMWIAALDLGVLFHSNGVFIQFTTLGDVGRSLSAVRVLYPDPVATNSKTFLLWMGTRNGLNKVLMSTNPFSNHIRNQESLRLNRGAVLSLCEDRKGILWTGLWGGGLDALQRVNGEYRRIANFKKDALNQHSLPNNDVGAVIEDRNENLWLGTAGGLAMLDKYRKHIVVFKHREEDSTSLVDNRVDDLYEDRSGTIWISTRGGLSEVIRGSPIRFRNYLIEPRASNEGRTVSAVFQDRSSNLWAATFGRGLNKLRPDGTHVQFLYSKDSSGAEENWIYCLVEDHEGLFWLSTHAGLVSFDPRLGIFTKHSLELQAAHIHGIFVDQRNDLWLSTAIGLAKFRPTTQSLTMFDEKYGLAFTELFSGFFKNSQGKLFVGGPDGFAEFSPDSIVSVSHPPEIAITSLSVYDKEIPASLHWDGEVRFSHDQNFLSLSFAALDYANPMRNRFKYRMVGVDNGWVDAGTRNYASYANLDPGNYVFQVRGSNSNNVWNESGTSISIVIAPPYWQAWWFRVLVAGLIAGTMYAAYRYRLKKLLDLERLRLRIANDLHDDVGSNLSAIAMVSRTAQRAPELTKSTKRKLSEIYDTAVLTSEGMKDLVWFIKPEDDTLDDVFLRMKDTASTLLGEIPVEFHSPKAGDSATVTIDFKRNVFLAFKEILTNIAKHAMATRVDIDIALNDSGFEMAIRDNGNGFDNAARHRGNGLQSLQKRALSIGGSCEITSGPRQGTIVKFSGKI